MAGDIGNELHHIADLLGAVGEPLHSALGAAGLIHCFAGDFGGMQHLLADFIDQFQQLPRGFGNGIDAAGGLPGGDGDGARLLGCFIRRCRKAVRRSFQQRGSLADPPQCRRGLGIEGDHIFFQRGTLG